MDIQIDSYCGLQCESCEYKQARRCVGCHASRGDGLFGNCEVAECVKEQKLNNCSECEDFPCEILHWYSFNSDKADFGARIERCEALRRQNGEKPQAVGE